MPRSSHDAPWWSCSSAFEYSPYCGSFWYSPFSFPAMPCWIYDDVKGGCPRVPKWALVHFGWLIPPVITMLLWSSSLISASKHQWPYGLYLWHPFSPVATFVPSMFIWRGSPAPGQRLTLRPRKFFQASPFRALALLFWLWPSAQVHHPKPWLLDPSPILHSCALGPQPLSHELWASPQPLGSLTPGWAAITASALGPLTPG